MVQYLPEHFRVVKGTLRNIVTAQTHQKFTNFEGNGGAEF